MTTKRNRPKLNVLYMEDDVKQRQVIARQLRRRGLSVTTARSGKHGVALLEKSSFSVLLCDLSLKDCDGLELLDTVHKLRPEMPVLILTAHGSVDQATEAIRHGAYHFILKPCEIADIELTIFQAVERASLERKVVRYSESLERKVAARTQELARINEELRQNERFLTKQNSVLSQLARRRVPHGSDFEASVQELTEVASETLEVERVGVWLFDPSRKGIRCDHLFRRTPKEHSSGGFINSADFPSYFVALETERIIAADDAAVDQRTCEFAPTYFKEHGITSMLDAPLWQSGNMIGVLCFEHTGPKRHWVSQEQQFAASIADFVALALEAHRRHKVEQALRESEAQNRAILDALPDLMFRLSRDGRYLDYKCPKDSPLAIAASDVIGKTFWELLPRELAESLDLEIKKVLETGAMSIVVYRLPHNDEMRDFESRLVRCGDDELLVIVRDVTDRKRAEEELRTAHEELERRVQERTAELANLNSALRKEDTERKRTLDELAAAYNNLRLTQGQLIQSEKMASLGMLVAGIAHEINTPIGAVSSMHNTLVRAMEKLAAMFDQTCEQGREETRKIQETLKVIQEANRVIISGTERVVNIVRRLRSFARLDEAEVKTVDIHEGIEDTLTLIHHEIKHSITVNKKFGNLPLCSCYPGRLNQVFLNLLINARQAIRDKGQITITTYLKDNRAHIEFTDTGSGIPPENLPRIFDPGFTTKGGGVGTGLGLAICYQIMQDHRGEIKVASELGVGTTFTVILPLDLEEQLEREAQAAAK